MRNSWTLRTRTVQFLVLAALSLALAIPSPAAARAAPESFADVVEALIPAVVNISTTQKIQQSEHSPQIPEFPPGSPFEDFFKDFFERHQQHRNQPRRANSLGSGFIIEPTGYVVTNNHVIAKADEIHVVLHDDRKFPAKVLGRDPKTDLALLKVDPGESGDLPFVRFGDSSKARVGDWVIAIGNPFGLGGTVTVGVISARARDINAGPYDDFLQTDAAINKGNSGGPMFNVRGEVIGINTAIFSPSGSNVGIGFAVPSIMAKRVIEQLRSHGRTRRGWLGVRIQQVTPEIAESLGLDRARGALVASVTPGGPAETSGLRVGDIITAFDGRDVEEMRRLPRIVAETEVGKRVPVTLVRGGTRRTVSVVLGELEKAEESNLLVSENSQTDPEDKGARTGWVKTLGLTLSALNRDIRREFDIPESATGVVITSVDENGPAYDKGLRPGDLIAEVQQEAVDRPEDVVALIKAVRKNGRKSVLLLVGANGDLRFVALPIGRE